ncbi:MAG: DUF2345 domain-containing protein [Betaproteobacteria bacterium]|nr:DUF2345 domain-containing protein [Betaproteobacteria bacterium]
MSTAGWQLRLRGPALQALRPGEDARVVDPEVSRGASHDAWQVLALHGDEAVNSLFTYRLRLRHPRLPPDLRPLLGRELQIHLSPPEAVDPGHGEPRARVISGLVSAVEHLGCTEGGHRAGGGAWGAGLTLRAWPCLAEFRTASRVYQERSVPEVLQQVLQAYGFAWELRLRQSYPRLDYQVQFDQSDWAFVEHLCARWGLHYHFEHDVHGHRLIFGDGPQAWKQQPLRAFRSLRLRARTWPDDTAALHGVCLEESLGVQAWQSLSQPECVPERIETWRADAEHAGSGSEPMCRWRGADGIPRARREIEPGRDAAQPDAAGEAALNRVRLRQARSAVSLLRAHGPLGGLCAAGLVRLLDLGLPDPGPEPAAGSGGPRDPSGQQGQDPGQASDPPWLVLATHLAFDAGTAARAASARPRVDLAFEARRLGDDVAAVPPTYLRRMPGTQTATVLDVAAVTAPGDARSGFTDALGRLKVRLHWADDEPDAATCWLRMARPAAGQGHGTADWPRPGQEVLVDFLDGDVDMPVCLGSVRNPLQAPPWPLPAACAVSGWRSRECLDDGSAGPAQAANHLLFDDTAGALQVQLASSSHDSALHLGRHAPVDPEAGRGPDRGEGFELRTRAQAAIRAPRALLLVGAAVTEAADSILQPLRACQARLRRALQARQAGTVTHDALQELPRGAVADLAEDLRGLAAPATAEQAGAVTPGAMVWRADGRLLAATPATGLVAAGSHLVCSAAGDLDAACLRGLRMHADSAAVLAANAQGLRLRAADGPVCLGAANSELHLLARDAVRLTAARRGLRLQAGARLVLQAAGQRVEFDAAGVRHLCSGSWRVLAARRDLSISSASGTDSGRASPGPATPHSSPP